MRFQADRDLVIIPNIIGSHLNPTAYGYNRMEKGPMETKLIFDATKPLPPYDFPKEAQAPDEVLKQNRSGQRYATLRTGERRQGDHRKYLKAKFKLQITCSNRYRHGGYDD